jgi:hypothetical protein
MLKIAKNVLIFYIGINYAYEQLGLNVGTLKWLILISLLVITEIFIFFMNHNINIKMKVNDEE